MKKRIIIATFLAIALRLTCQAQEIEPHPNQVPCPDYIGCQDSTPPCSYDTCADPPEPAPSRCPDGDYIDCNDQPALCGEFFNCEYPPEPLPFPCYDCMDPLPLCELDCPQDPNSVPPCWTDTCLIEPYDPPLVERGYGRG